MKDTELVRIKGADEPVPVRQLLAIGPPDAVVRRAEASLVGRRWEMAVLDAMVDRAIGGRGGVVNVVGPPGIGKSRVAREAAVLAAGRGVEVFWTFCESHASDIPFQVIARLLRTGIGVTDLDSETARARLQAQLPDADPQDLLLLDDLLGIADPDVPLPQIEPGCAATPVDRTDQHRIAGAHRHRRCTSSRTRTGSMRSASRCWPTSSPSFRRPRRWC